MWSEIKKNGIVAHNKKTQGKFTIPEGTASLVSTRLINMIQWIYDEFIQDSLIHSDIFKDSLFDEQQDFVTRNTSRILSYVNHVCVLENILVRLYSETISKLQIIDSSVIFNDKELKAREAEIADYFIFRNKVSAHTVYGSPRKTDNSAMEFHSLVTFLNSSYDSTGNADSFALGAVSVRLAGQDPSTKLPCLGLKELHPKMLEHINKWTQMLLDPCIEVRKKIPITISDTEYKIEG